MADKIESERRANRLSLKEQSQGMSWLQQRAEEALRRPQGEMAAALGEALGRPVTVGNLTTIAAAAGVRLHGHGTEIQERLERQVEAMRGLVERLSLEVQSTSRALDARLVTLERLVTQPPPLLTLPQTSPSDLGEGVQP